MKRIELHVNPETDYIYCHATKLNNDLILHGLNEKIHTQKATNVLIRASYKVRINPKDQRQRVKMTILIQVINTFDAENNCLVEDQIQSNIYLQIQI